MKDLTIEEIKKIAKLVNINLSLDEIESLKAKLSSTLNIIDTLKELDTSLINPTYQVTGLKNVFQTADSKKELRQEEALQNAKVTKKGLIVTKGVFNRE